LSPSTANYHISASPEFRDEEVIFARPWYPGYSATLDGRPLRLTAYRDMLPEVEIPPGSNGVLKVMYWPAGLTAALIGAACSGLILPGIAPYQLRTRGRVLSARLAAND